MKYIKTFEINKNKKIKIGYYVYCKENPSNSSLTDKEKNKVLSFVENNIGQIVKCDQDDKYQYTVKYENIPKELIKYFNLNLCDSCRYMTREEIIYFSPIKEEVELKIATNKYNI